MPSLIPHDAPAVGGIIFELPECFASDRSKGSIPIQTDDDEIQEQTPADVTDIAIVRLFNARAFHNLTKPKVAVNLSVYDSGRYAFQHGKSAKSNPYPKDTLDHAEWLDGFWDDDQMC